MAEDKKASFPKIGPKNWWTLRDRFKNSIPAKVSTNYVASVFGMSEDSARSNVLAPLRQTGLIDDEGKPTDLAARWRDDHEYPRVCEEIRERAYPQDLRDAFPKESRDFTGVVRWFMNHSKVGEPAGKMFATFLSLAMRS